MDDVHQYTLLQIPPGRTVNEGSGRLPVRETSNFERTKSNFSVSITHAI